MDAKGAGVTGPFAMLAAEVIEVALAVQGVERDEVVVPPRHCPGLPLFVHPPHSEQMDTCRGDSLFHSYSVRTPGAESFADFARRMVEDQAIFGDDIDSRVRLDKTLTCTCYTKSFQSKYNDLLLQHLHGLLHYYRNTKTEPQCAYEQQSPDKASEAHEK